MSARPSPSPSLPLLAQVAGMNWEIPVAPTAERELGFQFDSASICAATTAGVIVGQIDPARVTIPR